MGAEYQPALAFYHTVNIILIIGERVFTPDKTSVQPIGINRPFIDLTAKTSADQSPAGTPGKLSNLS